MALRSISICTGIAGIERGIQRAMPGCFEPILYVEREVSASAILAARIEAGELPPAPIWSDVQTVCDADCMSYIRTVLGGEALDLLTAGIPCQGNSLAGKRGLEDDPRNLWPATRRILRDVGAEWFFLENVYGLLVPERGKRYAPIARILGELSEDGFDAEWIVVSAADVGASQERARAFLLAHRCCSGRRESSGVCSRRDAAGRPQRTMADAGHSERGRKDTRRRSRRGAASSGTSESLDRSACEPCGQRERFGERQAGVAGAESGDQDGCGKVDDPARHGDTRLDGQGGSGRGVRGGSDEAGRPIDQRHQDEAATGRNVLDAIQAGERSRVLFGPFPPGPGFGLDRVAEGVLEDLERGAVGSDDRFLAELAQWASWQRILEVRPDLAPAISDDDAATFESGVRLLAHGISGRLGISRADQLRAYGNGVVPLQAAVAVMILWHRLMGD